MLETICNTKDIHNWKIRCILFEAYVMQTMLYEVELWGGSISVSTKDEIEKLQKSFTRRYVGLRVTTPYSILLIKVGCLPIEYHGILCVLRYIQKMKNMHGNRLPRQAWKISNELAFFLSLSLLISLSLSLSLYIYIYISISLSLYLSLSLS